MNPSIPFNKLFELFDAEDILHEKIRILDLPQEIDKVT